MEDETDLTLWVGNLAPDVDEELLYELFLQVGPVTRIFIPTNKQTGQNANYAFVIFKHEASVQYSIRVLEGTQLYGRNLVMKQRGSNQQNTNQHQRGNDDHNHRAQNEQRDQRHNPRYQQHDDRDRYQPQQQQQQQQYDERDRYQQQQQQQQHQHYDDRDRYPQSKKINNRRGRDRNQQYNSSRNYGNYYDKKHFDNRRNRY